MFIVRYLVCNLYIRERVGPCYKNYLWYLSRLWDVAFMTVRWLLWLAWNLYINSVLVPSRLVLKTVHGTFIRRQVTSVVQAVNNIRLTVVFRLLRRVSSDAASSRRSSTGLAPRTNSVPSWESTGIAASTADWRSALLSAWAETVRDRCL